MRLLAVLLLKVPAVAATGKEDGIVRGILDVLYISHFCLGETVDGNRLAVKHGLNNAHGVIGCILDGQDGRRMTSYGIGACHYELGFCDTQVYRKNLPRRKKKLGKPLIIVVL